MEGEQIPKATMNNFIKEKAKLSFSADFITKILYVSKRIIFTYLEYIVRISDKANDICTNNGKKTISV
jgi:hypothetical protein